MTDVASPIADGTSVGLLIGGKFYSLNLLSDLAGNDAVGDATANGTLLANLAAIKAATQTLASEDAGLATDSKLEAVRALLAATQAVSVASLPLPAGAATQATLAAILTALGTPLQAGSSVGLSGALPAGANAIGTVGVTALPALPAGANNIGSIANVTGTVSLPTGAATQTTLAAVLAALQASLPLPTGAATQTTLAAVLAALQSTLAISAAALPLPTGAATEATLAKTAPADNFIAITPSDSVALATVPKALLIGGAGNIAVKGGDGITVTIAVVAGQILPIRARYVMATNTTATGIVAIS